MTQMTIEELHLIAVWVNYSVLFYINVLENKNVYCKEQAGFRQNHRTTDHIFLLRYIIKKYTSKNNILYSCFVDFSKALDSIWRGALFKKLHQIGINGPFLQVIKSIYHTTQTA